MSDGNLESRSRKKEYRMDFRGSKKKRIAAAVIVLILIASMVLTTVLAAFV